MRIHVTGVAGTAMGSLAGLLTELGHLVTGSDRAFYPPMGPFLESLGLRLWDGFAAENLEAHPELDLPRADLVVVGNVCRRDNPEAVAADALGIPRLHIADALQRFALSQASPLVVAGTHGKTTTSSLAAHLLDRTGCEPGFLIGGIVEPFGRGYRKAGPRRLLSTGRGVPRKTPFVLEGDEYDTAFWEKTAKFLHYGAEVAIVTSLEHDHVDIYPTLESYEAAFTAFVEKLPKDGLLVAYAGDPRVVRLAERTPAEVAFYALEGEDTHGVAPHWMAAPAAVDESGITFDLFAGSVLVGRFGTRLPGLHNLKNALGALAAVAQGYGVPIRQLAEPLLSFGGVKRRQELRFESRGVRVYDDFAHHPTAVLETLRALRAKHRTGRVFAVFEPRSATACRRVHQTDYVRAFSPADVVLLAPIGRPELSENERLDVPELAASIRAGGQLAEAPTDVEAIARRVSELAHSGDTVVVLSNGAFGGIFERLAEALA